MNELGTTQLEAVTAIANNTTSIYTAKASGLYRSDDNGQSWHLMTDSGQTDGSPLTALAVIEDTILAGLNGGILHTDDNGQNWQVIPLASPPPLVSSIIVSPNFKDDGIAFASTAEDGVFVSMDHGKSWIPWNFGLIDLDIYCLAISPHFASDTTIYAGTETGIFCSNNIAKSWKDIPFPMESAPVLSIALTGDGQIFAGTEGNGLFVSDDKGQNWSPVPDIADAIIQTVLIVDGYVFVLTDQHLLEVHPLDLTSTTIKTFDDSQPIALGNAGDRWLVGYINGRVDSI